MPSATFASPLQRGKKYPYRVVAVHNHGAEAKSVEPFTVEFHVVLEQ